MRVAGGDVALIHSGMIPAKLSVCLQLEDEKKTTKRPYFLTEREREREIIIILDKSKNAASILETKQKKNNSFFFRSAAK